MMSVEKFDDMESAFVDIEMDVPCLKVGSAGLQARIKGNPGLDDGDVVAWCLTKILKEVAAKVRRGKNWYVRIDGSVITVNASSYTIITAHKEK